MFDRNEFEAQKRKAIEGLAEDKALQGRACDLIVHSSLHFYAYQRTWMGLPIIQLPEDILVDQELFWRTQPDVIIETGVAWGGSVAFHASMMALRGHGLVIAVDRLLPVHVRELIMSLPCAKHIHLIEGNSASQRVRKEVEKKILPDQSVALFLDSNHAHEHVLAELRSLSQFVTRDQYVSVYATAIEWLPKKEDGKPWGPGSNPHTAIKQFLSECPWFVVDKEENQKSLVSYYAGGRLKRIR